MSLSQQSKIGLYVGIAIIVVIAVIVITIPVVDAVKVKKHSSIDVIKNQLPPTESFFIAKDSNIDEIGAVHGTKLITDGYSLNPLKQFDEIRQNGSTGEAIDFGTIPGTGFDDAMSAYNEVLAISSNPTDVKSQDDLVKVQTKLNVGTNSAMFMRKPKSSKLTLDPTGTMGVIDPNVVPERDRNHNLYSVGTVLQMPAFNDISEERILQKDFNLSRISDRGRKGFTETKDVAPSVSNGVMKMTDKHGKDLMIPVNEEMIGDGLEGNTTMVTA